MILFLNNIMKLSLMDDKWGSVIVIKLLTWTFIYCDLFHIVPKCDHQLNEIYNENNYVRATKWLKYAMHLNSPLVRHLTLLLRKLHHYTIFNNNSLGQESAWSIFIWLSLSDVVHIINSSSLYKHAVKPEETHCERAVTLTKWERGHSAM